MKVVVRLAILVAALLLITGVALADQDCKCYKFTLTDMNGSNDKQSYYDVVCLDYAGNSGTITSGAFSMDLTLFFDYFPKYMIGSGSGCVAFYNIIGFNNTVIIGFEACGDNGGADRARVYGITVAMGLCNPT
jgi:hypothetical protein